GLSMGGLATLHFGLCYPDRALSLVVAGAGYGSDDPESNRKDVEQVARRFETEGMEKTGEFYAHGPSRVQLLEKDPVGWQEFRDRLCAGSRSEEHTSELQSRFDLVCRLLLEKKNKK